MRFSVKNGQQLKHRITVLCIEGVKMKHNAVGWTSMSAELVVCRFSGRDYQPP